MEKMESILRPNLFWKIFPLFHVQLKSFLENTIGKDDPNDIIVEYISDIKALWLKQPTPYFNIKVRKIEFIVQ